MTFIAKLESRIATMMKRYITLVYNELKDAGPANSRVHLENMGWWLLFGKSVVKMCSVEVIEGNVRSTVAAALAVVGQIGVSADPSCDPACMIGSNDICTSEGPGVDFALAIHRSVPEAVKNQT